MISQSTQFDLAEIFCYLGKALLFLLFNPRTKQLCYMCTKVDKIYMSRQGLQQLGIIGPKFPLPDTPKVSSITDPTPGCDCGCPPRPSSPPPPITFPSHLAGDTGKLKEYLLHQYGSTVFNTCECQNLPLLPGPPLTLNVDPNEKPVDCHCVQPILLHWKERVHRNLVRDVDLGVLEKLPTNTPTIWLSRMVITAKSNGDPRRTVDYQPLNKLAYYLCQEQHNVKPRQVPGLPGHHRLCRVPDLPDQPHAF